MIAYTTKCRCTLIEKELTIRKGSYICPKHGGPVAERSALCPKCFTPFTFGPVGSVPLVCKTCHPAYKKAYNKFYQQIRKKTGDCKNIEWCGDCVFPINKCNAFKEVRE